MSRVPRKLRACSTTARMSLMPASTADSAMNSALAPFATRRASVVLPVPGGPHRIIECGRPDSSARRSGAPGAQQMRLTHVLIERLRSQPVSQRAVGAVADSSLAAASDHIDARRRHE